MAEKLKHTILGVHITDRLHEAVEVQKQLTAYGKQIKTRLGLHEISPGDTGLNGILILELVPSAEGIAELTDKLNAIQGVEVKRMDFEHPAP
jgi:hypothetical protein